MTKKKRIISIILNFSIFLMVIAAAVVMFTGFKFMHGPEVILDRSNIEMFEFFTVDSNLFMAIVAVIFAVYEIMLLAGKIKRIPKWVYTLKLMSTSAVTLTFLVVFLYLGWIAKDGLPSLLMNSNLFLHLLVPITSIITFVCFEKTGLLKIKDTLWGLVPMFLYGLFYVSNVLIHTNHGVVSPKYDFYYFVYYGVWRLVIVIPLMFMLNYFATFILWKLNKRKSN